MTETSSMPIIRRSAWSLPFWEGVEEQELRYQHCNSCGRNVFPARRFCPHCAAADFEWRISSGNGTIYSFSVLELGAIAAFADQVPYAIIVVDLDEGFRMTSRMDAADYSVLRCDLPVRVSFGHLDAELPFFELADGPE